LTGRSREPRHNLNKPKSLPATEHGQNDNALKIKIGIMKDKKGQLVIEWTALRSNHYRESPSHHCYVSDLHSFLRPKCPPDILDEGHIYNDSLRCGAIFSLISLVPPLRRRS